VLPAFVCLEQIANLVQANVNVCHERAARTEIVLPILKEEDNLLEELRGWVQDAHAMRSEWKKVWEEATAGDTVIVVRNPPKAKAAENAPNMGRPVHPFSLFALISANSLDPFLAT
jgi:hypothetical protein